MSIERGVEPQAEPLRLRRVADDAVVVVRRALEPADQVRPLMPGEERENRVAVLALAQRLARLKSRGPEFSEIELSVYARQLLSGTGHVPLAS